MIQCQYSMIGASPHSPSPQEAGMISSAGEVAEAKSGEGSYRGHRVAVLLPSSKAKLFWPKYSDKAPNRPVKKEPRVLSGG